MTVSGGTVLSRGNDPTRIHSGGVVSAASFLPAPAPLVPGSLVSVFGDHLAALVRASDSFPLPSSLEEGAAFFFDDIPAPILYSSPSQMNLQVPFELEGRSRTTFRIVRNGRTTLSSELPLAQAGPAVFSTSGSGTGQGAVLHSDSGILSDANHPASRREILSIYATGLGPVQPSVPSGTSSPASATVSLPEVTIGGVSARVLYSGLAPGYAGLYQINVEVPEAAPSGTAVPLGIRIDGLASAATTVAIQ